MPLLPNGIVCWVLGFPVFPPSFKQLRRCLRCLSHQSSRILTLTNQAKNIMPDLLSLLAIVGFATIIFCCCWFLIFLCSRLWFDHLDRHQVDSHPYELPRIDPTSQDHPDQHDQHQSQVHLRPYDIPFWDYIGLDMEDLPPSYEEAVKMTLSTQV